VNRQSLQHTGVQPPDEIETRENRVAARFALEWQGKEGREIAPEARIPCSKSIDFTAFLKAVQFIADMDGLTERFSI
jgi:hypothetical protein